MRAKELKELIDLGESTTLEFKRKATEPEKLAKEIAAFANTKGGFLLIGVDDDGSIVGVKSEKSEIDIVETACSFYIDPPVEPNIEIVNYKNMDVIVVFIEQSKNKPHKRILENKEDNKKIKRAYIRVGEQSVLASREMSRILHYQNPDAPPVKLSIGESEKRLFAYLEKNGRATVVEFSKLANISKRRAERLMIALVRAGALQIHTDTDSDYFTLVL